MADRRVSDEVERIAARACESCGADSNGEKLCPRCEIRRAEDGDIPGVQTPTLSAALVAAQQAAQAVAKSSANNFHKYRYASAEALIAEGRAALNSAGLALSVSSSTWSGDTMHTVFLLEHVSGAHRTIPYDCPIVEDKGRPKDKAVATARTYSLGYMIRDLLLLPRVEEGTDADQRDDRSHEPAKADPKKVAEIGAILEQRIGDAKTLKELAQVGVDASDLPEGKVRDYLKEKYAQRQGELRAKPGPAKTVPS